MGVMQVMRSLLMAQPHRESIVGTNGIATFDDDFKGLMKLTVPFTPVQDGSGDPSPDNVRPISGWTGCEIKESGKNLLDQSLSLSRSIINSSSKKITANANYKVVYFKLKPNTNYIVSHAHGATLFFGLTKVMPATNVQCYEYIVLTNYNSYAFNSGDYKYVCLSCASTTVQMQLQLGQTATSYQAFKGKTIPITFTDPTTGDPMTVYNGTLTLNEDGSADLLVGNWILREMSKFSSISAPSATSGLYAHAFDLKNWTTSWDKSGGQANMLCDVGVVGQSASNYHIWGVNSTSDMYFYDDTISTVAEFKTKYAGCYILYRGKGANKTYHFDNVGQLKSFIGQNNVWTDLNGDPTVGYWKHG